MVVTIAVGIVDDGHLNKRIGRCCGDATVVVPVPGHLYVPLHAPGNSPAVLHLKAQK